MRTVKGVAKASSSLLGEDPLAFLGSSICMPTCRNRKMQNGQLLRLSLLCPQALCWLVLNTHISPPSVFLGQGWQRVVQFMDMDRKSQEGKACASHVVL